LTKNIGPYGRHRPVLLVGIDQSSWSAKTSALAAGIDQSSWSAKTSALAAGIDQSSWSA
jgi:hypothetical protein